MTGDAVNTAARLEAAAEPGEVLIGDGTHALVRDAVEVEPVEPLTFKGKAEPVPAHRLLEVVSETGQARRALLSAMVGRERELEDLPRAFARAAEDRSCLLFNSSCRRGRRGLLRQVAFKSPPVRRALTAAGGTFT